jgi:hypothetical protein
VIWRDLTEVSSLVLCVMFSRSLFDLSSFFFWSMCCLSFFYSWCRITLFLSSFFSSDFNGKLVELEVKEVILEVKTKFLNYHICLDVDQSI